MKQFTLILFSLFLIAVSCSAQDSTEDGSFTITTDSTYRMGAGDSEEMAKTLAAFGAKMKAVNLAAKYLTHKGVLAHYEKKQHEIFCLVPREITAVVVDEKFDAQARSLYVKVRCEISSIDFIQAENEDAELQKKESGFSFDQEMTQAVALELEPGKELSRAYRYIRKGEWRVAIIYLDHLQKKYANWGEVLLAKAIALYSTGDETGMLETLEQACRLGTQEACDELRSLSSSSS